MTDTYNPPEEKIDELIDRHTPRQLAIGYLRATRRARSAEAAFKTMDALNDATIGLASGDMGQVENGLKDALGVMKTHNGQE